MTERPKPEFGEGATQLTVRDRMNHAFLLANGVLVFQKTTTNQENQEAVVRETIMALFDIIPDVWEDKEFAVDIARARTQQRIDRRPQFCGVKASSEWCEEHGIQPFQTIPVYNHHLLMKACINLLERRNLLSRKIFKEIFTGKKFKGEKKGDIAEILDEMLRETGTM